MNVHSMHGTILRLFWIVPVKDVVSLLPNQFIYPFVDIATVHQNRLALPDDLNLITAKSVPYIRSFYHRTDTQLFILSSHQCVLFPHNGANHLLVIATGWCIFGMGCTFLCHCDGCDVCSLRTGECPNGCGASGGWSGPGCQIGE